MPAPHPIVPVAGLAVHEDGRVAAHVGADHREGGGIARPIVKFGSAGSPVVAEQPLTQAPSSGCGAAPNFDRSAPGQSHDRRARLRSRHNCACVSDSSAGVLVGAVAPVRERLRDETGPGVAHAHARRFTSPRVSASSSAAISVSVCASSPPRRGARVELHLPRLRTEKPVLASSNICQMSSAACCTRAEDRERPAERGDLARSLAGRPLKRRSSGATPITPIPRSPAAPTRGPKVDRAENCKRSDPSFRAWSGCRTR